VLAAALLIATTFAASAQAAAPSAVFDGPDSAVTGVPVGFDAARSSDAEGGLLRFSWSIDGQALDVDDAWLSVSFTHAGRHVVSVTVTDEGGSSSTVEHPVLVTGADRTSSDVAPLGAAILPAAAFPELVVRPLKVRVSQDNLRLELRCRGAALCRGRLRAVALVGRGTRERALLLTHRRFSILRGGPRVVRMRLGRAARSRLAAHPRVRVTAYRGTVRVAHIWATSAYRVR
jgi:hypothetical protein